MIRCFLHACAVRSSPVPLRLRAPAPCGRSALLILQGQAHGVSPLTYLMFLLPPAAESATGKAAVQRTTGESEHLGRSLRACGHVRDRDSNAYYQALYTCAGACFVQMQSYKARTLPQPLANLGSCARETSIAVHGTTRLCTCHHDIRGQVQHTYCVPISYWAGDKRHVPNCDPKIKRK
jgi:hypothetical protein